MKKSLFLILFIISACHQEAKKKQAIIQKNDFESLLGWSDLDPGRLIKGTAHSGSYAALTDSLHPFSAGFIRKIKDISDQRIKKIDINAWVLTTSLDAKASLVLSIESGGASAFYKGINVLDSVQATKKWYPVRSSFELPADLNRENEVRVYLWNTGKDAVLLDDVELRFYN